MISMKFRSVLLATALMSTGALPANAKVDPPGQSQQPDIGDVTNRGCSFSDLTGVSVSACTGFFSGNMLQGGNGNTVSAMIATQLGILGMASPTTATYLEKIPGNGGSFSVNFSTPLVGPTIIGIHLGNGSAVFNGSPAYNGSGGTAFYAFNAGATPGLDIFGLAARMSASSGVAVFQASPVPEAETYAMMLAGLGVVGFMARRRSKRSA